MPSRIRRGSVADSSLSRRASVAEPDGSREPVPYKGMRSGPNLPRVDAGLGNVPKPSCPGGSLYGFLQSTCMRQGLWGYSSTLVRILQCRGWRFLDGGACCGLRPPSGEGPAWPAPLSHLPTLQRFWVQGDTLYPRRGRAPCTLRGGRRVLLWSMPSFSGGIGIGLRRCLTCPPSNAFGNRGTPPVPPAGAAPPAPCLGGRRGAVHTKPARATFLPSLRQVAGVEGPDLDQPSVHRVVPPLEGRLEWLVLGCGAVEGEGADSRMTVRSAFGIRR